MLGLSYGVFQGHLTGFYMKLDAGLDGLIHQSSDGLKGLVSFGPD